MEEAGDGGRDDGGEDGGRAVGEGGEGVDVETGRSDDGRGIANE